MDSDGHGGDSSHLSSLVDSQNIAEVGTNHTTVDQSFIEKKGVRPITVYRGLTVDTHLGAVMAECCNPECTSRLPLLEARTRYKSCHHCYTYYCSRRCRQEDWQEHKMLLCPLARAASATKAVIRRILADEDSHNAFSSLGRCGYLRLGRGCIVLWFRSCAEAETFAQCGARRLSQAPVYVSIGNIQALLSRLAPTSLSSVHGACSVYDPDENLVINVSVSTEDARTPTGGSVRARHVSVHAVKKCATIALSRSFLDSHSAHCINDSLRPTSLLLTMLPGQQYQTSLSHEDRQIIFVHVLRQLEARGVDLRSQYPRLYRDLTNFVEHNAHFGPTTIFPRDVATGRPFVCMIAPMSDPVTLGGDCGDQSGRSSIGSFIAELEVIVPQWHQVEITEV